MRLTELLLRDKRTSLQRLGLMAMMAGATSTIILAIVNYTAALKTDSGSQLLPVLGYSVSLLVYIFSQRYVLQTTTDEVERIVDERRRTLIRKLADCELQGVEKIGHGAIFSAINTDTQTISQNAGGLVLGVQALLMIFWTTIYIATLSVPALLLVVVVLGLAARLYHQRGQRAAVDLACAHDEVVALHEMVEGLLAGFKEVKLSSRRAAELLQDAVTVSGRTAFFRSLAQRAQGANFVFSQAAIYILLGTLVFILPALSSSFADSTLKVMTTVLFLVGPVSGVIAAAPQITVANAAAENMLKLEQLFDQNVEQGRNQKREDAAAAAPTPASFNGFNSIDLRHLMFARGEGEERFVVGPVDLSIQRGETLFITGGNGAGKTTFIKMLTGLYPADSGEILVDGRLVERADMQNYRDMFGAVFSDFHLFQTLHGVERIDRERAAALIEEMEIGNKAHLDGRRFSTVDLSSGQRKRLALVATQLENPPIMVLDEWAADQDPHFRAKFYQLVLPRLRAAGITVIAITHDDKYFHHADRRLHLEDGRVTSIASKGAAT